MTTDREKFYELLPPPRDPKPSFVLGFNEAKRTIRLVDSILARLSVPAATKAEHKARRVAFAYMYADLLEFCIAFKGDWDARQPGDPERPHKTLSTARRNSEKKERETLLAAVATAIGALHKAEDARRALRLFADAGSHHVDLAKADEEVRIARQCVAAAKEAQQAYFDFIKQPYDWGDEAGAGLGEWDKHWAKFYGRPRGNPGTSRTGETRLPLRPLYEIYLRLERWMADSLGIAELRPQKDRDEDHLFGPHYEVFKLVAEHLTEEREEEPGIIGGQYTDENFRSVVYEIQRARRA